MVFCQTEADASMRLESLIIQECILIATNVTQGMGMEVIRTKAINVRMPQPVARERIPHLYFGGHFYSQTRCETTV